MNAQRGVARLQWWLATVATMAFLLVGLIPNVHAQRDPGLNQPGVVGNRGYGLGGSARQTRALADPRINQPGAVGNRGRDPGVNQPGAARNVGRDPGLNQPGAVGNRRGKRYR